jgi:hypothetical protein
MILIAILTLFLGFLLLLLFNEDLKKNIIGFRNGICTTIGSEQLCTDSSGKINKECPKGWVCHQDSTKIGECSILCDCNEYKITNTECGKNQDNRCSEDDTCLNINAKEPCHLSRSSFKVTGELGKNMLSVVEGKIQQNELKEGVLIEINDSEQRRSNDKGQYLRYEYTVTKIESDKITINPVLEGGNVNSKTIRIKDCYCAKVGVCNNDKCPDQYECKGDRNGQGVCKLKNANKECSMGLFNKNTCAMFQRCSKQNR